MPDLQAVDFTAAPGGVMTDEVGTVTGDLTMREETEGDTLRLRVQYKDAGEWYTVEGGTAPVTDAGAVAKVRALREQLLAKAAAPVTVPAPAPADPAPVPADAAAADSAAAAAAPAPAGPAEPAAGPVAGSAEDRGLGSRIKDFFRGFGGR